MAKKSLATKEKIPTETYEQIKFVIWARKIVPFLSASANGGSRHMIEAIKFKRMGVSAGFPDIEIPFPVKPYHGLYIEFKRVKGGAVSEQQYEWIDYLNSVGYLAVVCRGAEQAKKVLLHYLGLSDPSDPTATIAKISDAA